MFKLLRGKASALINQLFLINSGWLIAFMFTIFAFFVLRVGTIMCHMGHGIPLVFREMTNFSVYKTLPVGFVENDSCGFYLAKPLSKHYPSEDWKKSPGYVNKEFPVRAVLKGIVYFCGNCRDERRKIVRIIHNTLVDGLVIEVESIYAGLDEIIVKPGPIEAGQILGFVEEDGTLSVQIRDCIGTYFWGTDDSPCGKTFRSSKW